MENSGSERRSNSPRVSQPDSAMVSYIRQDGLVAWLQQPYGDSQPPRWPPEPRLLVLVPLWSFSHPESGLTHVVSGSSEGQVIKDSPTSTLLSLGSLTMGEASYHVVRRLKQCCGGKLRPPTNSPKRGPAWWWLLQPQSSFQMMQPQPTARLQPCERF